MAEDADQTRPLLYSQSAPFVLTRDMSFSNLLGSDTNVNIMPEGHPTGKELITPSAPVEAPAGPSNLPYPIPPGPRLPEDEEDIESPDQSRGGSVGSRSADSEAPSGRNRSSSQEIPIDIRAALLQRLEKLERLASAVKRDLADYIRLADQTLSSRASMMVMEQPEEEYTQRLEFVVSPNEIEYCNKALDPPIEVCLLDANGASVSDRTLHLRIVICDGEGKPIEKTTTGSPLVTGTSEAVLTRGRASFQNVRIMEVSSKHMNKNFRIVVEPKIRCGVRPCMSRPFRVYAKKTPGKARRGPDGTVSDGKRLKHADQAGPAPY